MPLPVFLCVYAAIGATVSAAKRLCLFVQLPLLERELELEKKVGIRKLKKEVEKEVEKSYEKKYKKSF